MAAAGMESRSATVLVRTAVLFVLVAKGVREVAEGNVVRAPLRQLGEHGGELQDDDQDEETAPHRLSHDTGAVMRQG